MGRRNSVRSVVVRASGTTAALGFQDESYNHVPYNRMEWYQRHSYFSDGMTRYPSGHNGPSRSGRSENTGGRELGSASTIATAIRTTTS